MKKTIFLSYSSAQSEMATRIELSLKGEGHAVFRDRSSLPPGESFDTRIRAAIDASDLFIFLISRESISQGRYTLTELKFAEQKWEHPAGRVLPVFAEATPKEVIPAFLRAVTILQPRGDIAAEVVAEVDRMTTPRIEPQRLTLTAVVALVLVGGAWMGLSRCRELREQAAQAEALVKQGQSLSDVGNYAGAWEVLERANAAEPASDETLKEQEKLAMEWLRNARVSQSGGNFTDIVNRVAPVLSRGAAGAKGERLADLLAHMGWGDYLRSRDGVGGLDPVRNYRRALEVDQGNVFAHAMWGFEILRKSDSLAEGKRHFSIALESRREREYVRHLQISGLLWVGEQERENEAIRVANEMRSNGEPRPKDEADHSDKHRLWNIYYFRLATGREKPQFLAALSPADHLATFRWLFPEDELSKDKKSVFLFVLAQLQEHSGERAVALESYQRLQGELARSGYTEGRMVDDSTAAIKRLSSSSQ